MRSGEGQRPVTGMLLGLDQEGQLHRAHLAWEIGGWRYGRERPSAKV